MEPLTFDPHNHKKNRTLLDHAFDECDVDAVDGVDITTGQSVFAITLDVDPVLIKFYCYLSDLFANGSQAFMISDEMKEVAYAFFGESAWNDGGSKQIAMFKNPQDIEIILE